MNSHWEAVKEFYKEKFGIDSWVVEMYANLDILSLCVSGASVETIVQFLELSPNEVVQVVNDTFDFNGWTRDLPINPYRMFSAYMGNKGSKNHFTAFVSEVRVELGKYSGYESVDPEKIFYMCETYSDIEERIQNEWI
jgi:hypothetical protein